MKKLLLGMSALLLAACGGQSNRAGEGQGSADSTGTGLSGQIQLSGAFALYPMAVKWAEEFKTIHPDVKIDISGGGAGKGMTDALAGVVDIGMVSRDVYPEELEKGAWVIPTVKDAVVPTFNANNPHAKEIRAIGLKRETAIKLWGEEIKTWGEILGNSSKAPVHVFTRSDACGAAETFAAWLGRKQENLKATAVFGDPGVASAVQKDKFSVGYNNIAYAYDQHTKKPFEGLAVVPIDVDGNGKIDPEEDCYDNVEALIKAINEGRYPSPPARYLNLVTKGKPTKPEVVEFLRFILTEGQKYAGETGYIPLPAERAQEEIGRLE